MDDMRADTPDLESGVVAVVNGILTNVHPPTLCVSQPCWVHNPSVHHMNSWPIGWREDKHTAERHCQHGIGHPDPDDAAFHLRNGRDVAIHGCDGCCAPPEPADE